MDRRAQRTRESLHHALISLMIAKQYETITIQDIIDRANVGRATFYSHYRGKDDLLKAGFKQLQQLLQASQRAAFSKPKHEQRSFEFTLTFFEHAGAHRTLYQAIVGKRSGAVVMNAFRALLSDLVKVELRKQKITNANISSAAMVAFIVGGLLAMLAWWLERPSHLSAVEVHVMFEKLCAPMLEQ